MPPNESNDDSIFDDDLDFDTKPNGDWDFPFMEYTWSTVLKRSDDFYRSTPKNFFNQIEIHNKLNGVKPQKVEYI